MPKEMPREYGPGFTDDNYGWFVGIIVALALLAIGYLVFSADTPSTALASAHVKVETAKGHGSGTHIGDGYFVTAAHVVTDQPSAKVDGASAEILWVNRDYDIALLRGPVDHQSVPLACVVPAIGETADAHGNPGDLTDITTSVRVAGEASQLGLWRFAVPVDGALAPGMSGGGIVSEGRLIGVTVGVAIVPLGFSASLYGVGFIVPGSVVCGLMGRV